MTKPTKQEKEKAYAAGRRNALSEPPDRRGVDACPFPPDTEERNEWVRGFDEVEADPEAAAEEESQGLQQQIADSAETKDKT